MRPRLKHLLVNGVSNPQEFCPNDPQIFCVAHQALIGPSDADGEESFEFFVCSPGWVEKEVETGAAFLATHCIFVREYDYSEIREFVTAWVSRIEGKDWMEIANTLRLVGAWEFDDYTANE